MANVLFRRIIFVLPTALVKTFDFLVSKFAVDKPVLKESELPFSQFLHDSRLVFLKEYNNYLNERRMHNVTDFYKVGTVNGPSIQDHEIWKGIPLVLFDYLFKDNSRMFPETMALSKQLPGCRSIMFLVAGPGKHILPHRGVYKGVYRGLFTVQLPENADCWIRVDKHKIYFREGETIVFDETFEHEVLNSSPAPRVVLSFDFYRKLPFPINLMNALIFFLLKRSFFAKNILNAYGKLENEAYEYFKSVEATL